MNSTNADTLRHSASDALDSVQSAAAPAIKESKRQAGVLLDQSGDLFSSVTRQAGETAADLTKAVVAYTKKNPLVALLLAVGAGALLLAAAKTVQSRR